VFLAFNVDHHVHGAFNHLFPPKVCCSLCPIESCTRWSVLSHLLQCSHFANMFNYPGHLFVAYYIHPEYLSDPKSGWQSDRKPSLTSFFASRRNHLLYIPLGMLGTITFHHLGSRRIPANRDRPLACLPPMALHIPRIPKLVDAVLWIRPTRKNRVKHRIFVEQSKEVLI